MLSVRGTALFGGGKVVIGYAREAVQAKNPKQQL